LRVQSCGGNSECKRSLDDIPVNDNCRHIIVETFESFLSQTGVIKLAGRNDRHVLGRSVHNSYVSLTEGF